MIETVTAIFGLLSASIFLAHAFEGYRSRPRSIAVPRGDSEIFNKVGSSSSIESGRCIMRNHDFVSDGFLAITAAGFMLLCSSLLAAAFT